MIDKKRLEQFFVEMVKIYSPSGGERKLADYVKNHLQKLGLEVKEDNTGEKTGGNAGNIIAYLPGKNKDGPTILFTAHLDRVEPGENIEPVQEDGIFRSKGETILAADDISGIAPIFEALYTIKDQGLDHYPVQLVFTVSEEVGLLGAKNLEEGTLKADFGYAFDSNGPVGNIIIKGPTHNSIKVKIKGKASHAGVSPEEGINAIKVASVALAEIEQGRIDSETTSNIGTIKGGKARNVVPDEVEMAGEVRSHDPEKLSGETEKMENIFRKAAEKYGAKLEFEAENLYPSFEFSAEEEVVKRCKKALEKLGKEANLLASGGGSDANIFNGKGVPTLNLATGMEKAHSTDEYIPFSDLVDLSKLIVNILRD